MSLLTDASLVLVPSAYRTGEVLVQKPLPTKFSDETGNYDGNDPQGSANLTFTRNSNASRVTADGKVERVRTNEIGYSSNFANAVWAKQELTLTAGQSDPFGGNNATIAKETAATNYHSLYWLFYVPTASNFYTQSIYVKSEGRDQIQYAQNSRTRGFIFTFSTGAISGVYGSPSAYSAEDIGGGWFRLSMTWSQTNSPFNFGFLEGYNGSTNNYAGDITKGFRAFGAQLELSDFGPTPYIPTTTSARSTFAGISVDGTSVPNVPRLDYSGGASCPSLLLEPQRTNLYTYSEYSGAWNKTNWTTTDNYAISPEGVKNAFRAVSLNTSGILYISGTGVTGQKNTLSVWAKSNTGSDQKFRFFTDGNTNTSSDFTATTEWQRFEYTHDCTFVTAGIKGASSELSDILFYGFQHEAGSYVSSYIPTLGASVTRLADAATKTGISSLIGQTEGTLFLDVENVVTQSFLMSFNESTTASVSILKNPSNQIQCQVWGSSLITILSSAVGSERLKIGFAYKSGSTAVYINGTQVGVSSTAFTFSATMDTLLFPIRATYFAVSETAKVNQTLLFKTRLSNADLANLTAL